MDQNRSKLHLTLLKVLIDMWMPMEEKWSNFILTLLSVDMWVNSSLYFNFIEILYIIL